MRQERSDCAASEVLKTWIEMASKKRSSDRTNRSERKLHIYIVFDKFYLKLICKHVRSLDLQKGKQVQDKPAFLFLIYRLRKGGIIWCHWKITFIFALTCRLTKTRVINEDKYPWVFVAKIKPVRCTWSHCLEASYLKERLLPIHICLSFIVLTIKGTGYLPE